MHIVPQFKGKVFLAFDTGTTGQTFHAVAFGRAQKARTIYKKSERSILLYYIHTEIYSLESREVNFRSQAGVSQSNDAYRFFTCEKNDTSNQEPRIMFFHV